MSDMVQVRLGSLTLSGMILSGDPGELMEEVRKIRDQVVSALPGKADVSSVSEISSSVSEISSSVSEIQSSISNTRSLTDLSVYTQSVQPWHFETSTFEWNSDEGRWIHETEAVQYVGGGQWAYQQNLGNYWQTLDTAPGPEDALRLEFNFSGTFTRSAVTSITPTSDTLALKSYVDSQIGQVLEEDF